MKRIALPVTVAMVFAASSATSVAAHAGHSHEERGTNFGAIGQMAIAAVAVAIVYLLVSYWFRYRDRG
jgi:hypothetical protein